MNDSDVEAIANAVLYEGYILYPYRPSSVKNRQRWTFGGVTPRAYSDAQGGSEAWTIQSECLVEATPRTAVGVRVRFLHLLARQVGELTPPLPQLPDGCEPAFQPVESLQAGDRLFQTWEEATERSVEAADLRLSGLAGQPPLRVEFSFPALRTLEPLPVVDGRIAGIMVREQRPIKGVVEILAERLGQPSPRPGPPPGPLLRGGDEPLEDLFRLQVQVMNLTPFEDEAEKNRQDALMQSLVSCHMILQVRDGEFVSLLDPPDSLREAAAACQNSGVWPVLAGNGGRRQTMLASPIILYDYPQVAPESPGDLFDATEIDEILTLRILTLTDEEKREMRALDERGAAILDRTDAMSWEQLANLHGAVRSLRPLDLTPGPSPRRRGEEDRDADAEVFVPWNGGEDR